FFSYPVLPGNPEAFSEGWMASSNENGVKGQFWDLNEIEEVRVGMGQLIFLQSPSVILEAGETRRLTRIWMVCNATDWTDVRRLYQARVLREQHLHITEDMIKSRPAFDFDISPVMMTSIGEHQIDVTARKALVAPLPVNLAVDAPKGWMAELHLAEPSGNDREDLSRLDGHPLQDQELLSMKVIPTKDIQDRFAIHTGSLNLTLTSSRRTPFHIIQLGASGNKVVVEESEEEGLKVFTVRNGLTEFKVSADYGGCLYSLKNSKGTELLVSTFPTAEPKPGGMLQNYFGGVQPVIWDDAFDEDLTGALTNREKMKAKVIEHGVWKGVEVSWVGKVQVTTRGVKIRLQYLTTPGSPLIMTRWIIDNVTSAPVSFYPSLYVDPGFDGDPSQMVFRTEWEGRVTDIYSGQIPAVPIPSSNALWVRKGDSDTDSEGLGVISPGSLPGMMGIFLGPFMMMSTLDLTVKLQPKETREIVNCFVVNPEKQDDLAALQSVLSDLL
ncbi:MAG: hypothetical protein P1Q69_06830, partial [Candidatus Thorarchaeota archaeon]|nr:hypothetical protein [Candidatus Thorarchaeota archaeon]